MSNIIARHNIKIKGEKSQAMLLAHGFGCDQSVWRFLVPTFAARHRVVTFDYVGMGGANASAYDPVRHATLDGYASDLLEVCDALNLENVIFVGHSVSAMIGVLAANRRPELFGALVMVGPSPSYIDDVDYRGGFQREQIEAMLQSINSDFPAWARAMGPAIMGNPGSRFELLDSTGHCPHISAPEEMVAAIERFLATLGHKVAV